MIDVYNQINHITTEQGTNQQEQKSMIPEADVVQNCLKTMNDNQSKEVEDFASALNHISLMEHELYHAKEEISALKKILQESDQKINSDINQVSNQVRNVENSIPKIENILQNIKQHMKDSTHQMLENFKEKGRFEFQRVIKSLKVKEGLDLVRSEMRQNIKDINEIKQRCNDTFHELNQGMLHMQNAGSVLVGKEIFPEEQKTNQFIGLVNRSLDVTKGLFNRVIENADRIDVAIQFKKEYQSIDAGTSRQMDNSWEKNQHNDTLKVDAQKQDIFSGKIQKEFGKNGFKIDKKVVEKVEKLNQLTDKEHSAKDIAEAYKKGEYRESNSEAQKIVDSIGKQMAQQEVIQEAAELAIE